MKLLNVLIKTASFTMQESAMSELIRRWCHERGYACTTDAVGNVYITKGRARWYPCVTAHLDTVFPTVPHTLQWEEDRVLGFDEHGRRCGVGGDDKAGVWVCLKLLEHVPVLKVALFVGEESFCYGSQRLNSSFFADVGYAIGFDCPTGRIFGYKAEGLRLFENQGRFIETALPILRGRGYNKMHSHPYTDIYCIRQTFGIQCLSMGSGYYNLHSCTEFIHVAEMMNCFETAKAILEALGYERFEFQTEEGQPPFPESPFDPRDLMDNATLKSVARASREVCRLLGIPWPPDPERLQNHFRQNPGRYHKLMLKVQTEEFYRNEMVLAA